VLKVWDKSGALSFSAQGSGFVRFTPDGRQIWTGVKSSSFDASVQIYDVNGSNLGTIPQAHGVSGIAIPSNDRRFIFGSEPGPSLRLRKPSMVELLQDGNNIDALTLFEQIKYGIKNPTDIIESNDEGELIELKNYLQQAIRDSQDDAEKVTYYDWLVQTLDKLVTRRRYQYHIVLLSVLNDLNAGLKKGDYEDKIVQEIKHGIGPDWDVAARIELVRFYLRTRFALKKEDQIFVRQTARRLIQQIIVKRSNIPVSQVRGQPELREERGRDSGATSDEI
jgi:hypothetical protein